MRISRDPRSGLTLLEVVLSLAIFPDRSWLSRNWHGAVRKRPFKQD